MPEPKFYKPDQFNLKWFKTYSQKMWCLDDPLDIQGNYDTIAARTPSISLVKCDREKRTTCKSDKEIDDFVRGKFLITIENSWKFHQDEYGINRVEPYSRFRWYPLEPSIIQETYVKFSVKDMTFQDSFF